jgi:hypothetical protein
MFTGVEAFRVAVPDIADLLLGWRDFSGSSAPRDELGSFGVPVVGGPGSPLFDEPRSFGVLLVDTSGKALFDW